ncbi:unnamed protein product [Effrenium voratum]|uniref:Apple domain-containing protein n=1 Tax=Effrenium voratum TaxID=2562239 RepID=A0AA36JIU1_9DINO|nr:unnamed protein product [Effrenium voratum]CAJ1438225.1 unnamed protein product [Effrenium voratum]
MAFAIGWHVVALWCLAAAEPALRSFWPHQCCTTCLTRFCSPRSGNCYDQKRKDYYLECKIDCCNSCAGLPFCSPVSGNCYDQKRKNYYLECTMPQGTMPQPTMPQGTMPQDTMPQGTMPQPTMPQPTMPQGAMPQPTMPQGTMPQPTMPQGTMPQGTMPQGTVPQPQPPTFPMYYYAGEGRCDPATPTKMASFSTATAAECRGSCQNTPGCKVFDFLNPSSACGGTGLCQLHYAYCSMVTDPCWEQYRLD